MNFFNKMLFGEDRPLIKVELTGSFLYVPCITVIHGYAGQGEYGWQATLSWQDARFCENGTVEGEIRTRYFLHLTGSSFLCFSAPDTIAGS